jgi:hypothetical protein
MQIPVLLEKVAGDGYRARGGEPFGFTAEGATRDEALARLRQLVLDKLQAGADVVPLEIPSEHPLLRRAGRLDPNDPVVQEWLEIMAENRRKAEEDPEYL